jgi:hypothetical protein
MLPVDKRISQIENKEVRVIFTPGLAGMFYCHMRSCIKEKRGFVNY